MVGGKCMFRYRMMKNMCGNSAKWKSEDKKELSDKYYDGPEGSQFSCDFSQFSCDF